MKTKLLMLLLLTAVLVSCKKDEEEPAKPTLAGTIWESVSGTQTYTLTFTGDATFVLHFIDTEDNNVETTSGTYVYSPPSITLVNPDENEPGNVNGNTMTFNSGYVFTKL